MSDLDAQRTLNARLASALRETNRGADAAAAALQQLQRRASLAATQRRQTDTEQTRGMQALASAVSDLRSVRQ